MNWVMKSFYVEERTREAANVALTESYNKWLRENPKFMIMTVSPPWSVGGGGLYTWSMFAWYRE